ncbi:MAG: cobalamin-binding protein [Firmicutes bacterium]|jgi:5-methyltetrahydrofolate--homocysteine methyltransferase|nr:cobalamin-binding protein [Bacillota bacterium]
MEILEQISELLQQGRAKEVQEAVEKALDQGLQPQEIISGGLLAGMSVIGAKFKVNEVYVPDVLIASRAMNAGMETLKPYIVEADMKPIGKIVLGTVEGDLHDIGKNLVKIMFEGAGFEVFDLGIDVAADRFVTKVKEEKPQILAMSALLTTTMTNMEKVIKAVEKEGLREGLLIMVGGAPVTESFAQSIGADLYAPDAASAAELAREKVAAL